MKLTSILILLSFISMTGLAGGNKNYQPSDVAVTVPAPYDYSVNEKYKGIKIFTYYVTMRDSVKIALDVYLPKDLKEGEKLPAILHQTRYWRSPDIRWPFSMFTDGLVGRAGEMIKTMVANGYAIVNVDARGSGASFGSRIYPWAEDEVKDGAEIVDWIINQHWSDGMVGTMGVSYSGTTAEFLLTNKHPNVKAAILLYSLFDVYDDIAFPGGIFHSHFVNNWGRFNSKLDRNKFPRKSFIGKLLVKGVRRVNTANKVRTFRAAIRDHEDNLNVNETSKGVTFRDDPPQNDLIEGPHIFSPYYYIDDINHSGAAVYSYSGWMDGNYQHANIKRHLNLTNPQNKLLIGPWEHGGKFNCSPANPGLAGFDHVAEFLKFFDYHMKGIDNGLYNEPSVHYFTMGEENWKSADSWPPDSEPLTLFFVNESGLSTHFPDDNNGFDVYPIDTTAGTGDDSRWKSLIGMLKTPHVYPDRTEQNKTLQCYTSAPLTSNLEVSGHPMVTLFINSTVPDGNFHVYLEEVNPGGNVTYITEGLLRAIHRKPSAGKLYEDAVPHRSYKKEDAMPLIPDKVEELKFDLLPTSYLFKKGNRIRISIAGADQDHFKVMFPAAPEIKIYRNADYPSKVELPVAGNLNTSQHDYLELTK